MTEAEVADVLLDLAHRRGAGKTYCPSEAARALSPDWRDLMPVVREVAFSLADQDRLAVFQKGKLVKGRTAKGPIRLGLPQALG